MRKKDKQANSTYTGRSREQKFLEIINNTLGKNSHIGDDCANLKDFSLVVTQDALIEDVHFDLSAISPKKLGRKALLVNISDVLASGAKPKYLTISLSGTLDEKFIQEFYTGVNEICSEFDVEIIGGDLTGGEKIAISICALGDTTGRKISSRSNAQEGYFIAVCGIFGTNKLSNYHTEPQLYPHTAEAIATKCKEPYALMDSSDSLYDCLEQISRKSGVRIEVDFDKIPHATDVFETTVFGGEDYCLVGCFSENDYEEIKKNDDCLIKIGTVKQGSGIFIDGVEIKEDLSYVHFKN